MSIFKVTSLGSTFANWNSEIQLNSYRYYPAAQFYQKQIKTETKYILHKCNLIGNQLNK